ncbi:MAG TPA: ATP-binding cassette domain-containing protein [Gemmatimonadota bacterium]|nr:ATP-binding cassette domain-containing protein [Gemmatimonadota bacterium]
MPQPDLSPEPAILLAGITKRFGDHLAVDGLDLAVPRGATYGLLGPNGAGKTTAIRILLRILEPDAGRVRLLGMPVRREVLDRVGYLPEERGLYRRMRVRDLLAFLAELKGVPGRASQPRIAAWLERFDLADRAEDRVQDLSKGMQQKLQFIAAVLHEPQVVVLDEPFGGLDPINQRILREIVTELRGKGCTLLFSTHLIENAERLCDHVCIIARGRKIVDGPLARVRREHGGTYIALTLDGADEPGADGPGADGLGAAQRSVQSIREAPLVERVTADGSELEVALIDGAQSNEFLAWLVERGISLRRFERVEPSLQQIFIERVGVEPDRV